MGTQHRFSLRAALGEPAGYFAAFDTTRAFDMTFVVAEGERTR
jgi:hypothetical protein